MSILPKPCHGRVLSEMRQMMGLSSTTVRWTSEHGSDPWLIGAQIALLYPCSATGSARMGYGHQSEPCRRHVDLLRQVSTAG